MTEMEIIETADDAILKSSIDNLKNYDTHIGRAPRYADNEDGLELFRADTIRYFESVRSVNAGLDEHEKPLVITVEAWLTSLGLTRQSLSRYRARSEAWKEFIDFVRENILCNKLQRYMTGQASPVQAIFDLVNNHSYVNTSEAGHTNQQDIITQSNVVYPKLEEPKTSWSNGQKVDKVDFCPIDQKSKEKRGD